MRNEATQHRQDFSRRSEQVRTQVSNWPSWKQGALGSVPQAPSYPPRNTPRQQGQSS